MGTDPDAVEVGMIPDESGEAPGTKRSASSSSSFKRKTGEGSLHEQPPRHQITWLRDN